MRLAQARFLEQFRRMLMSRLRVVFENASSEIELWNRAASAQIDAQLRDRRRTFKRRRDSLERIQAAAGELETRLAELESADQRIGATETELALLFDAARRAARRKDLGPNTGGDNPAGGADVVRASSVVIAPVDLSAMTPLPDLDLDFGDEGAVDGHPDDGDANDASAHQGAQDDGKVIDLLPHVPAGGSIVQAGGAMVMDESVPLSISIALATRA
jgi:hypothetical protein